MQKQHLESLYVKSTSHDKLTFDRERGSERIGAITRSDVSTGPTAGAAAGRHAPTGVGFGSAFRGRASDARDESHG